MKTKVVALILAAWSFPALSETSVIFDDHASPYSFIVPNGVTSIVVDATGGGSGSAGVGYGNPCLIVGNPGQNGDFVRHFAILVQPGDVLEITVGTGGTFGMAAVGAGCYNGGTGDTLNGRGDPYVGKPGGDTAIFDMTSNTSLLVLRGGLPLIDPTKTSTTSAICATQGCSVAYALSAGLAGWASNGGSPQATGGYYLPISQFAIGINHDQSWASYGAVFFSGSCLSAEPGIYYGQGASSSVSINSPSPGCAGNSGAPGVAILTY